MEDLGNEIVELVLKKVSDYCEQHESCMGCKFSKAELYRAVYLLEEEKAGRLVYPLPEGAEILTAEAYSDLCLRASRIPCYLGSPCEYQNENIEIPQCDNDGDCEHCDWATCPDMEGAEE